MIERQRKLRGGSAGDGHGDGENCVRAEIGFVRSAIGVNHAAIDGALVGSVHTGDGFGDFDVHVTYGLEDSFAEVAGFISVAEFDGFVFAGGGAGRDGSAADGTAFDSHFGFDCGIPARIDNFTCADGDNFRGHCAP